MWHTQLGVGKCVECVWNAYSIWNRYVTIRNSLIHIYLHLYFIMMIMIDTSTIQWCGSSKKKSWHIYKTQFVEWVHCIYSFYSIECLLQFAYVKYQWFIYEWWITEVIIGNAIFLFLFSISKYLNELNICVWILSSNVRNRMNGDSRSGEVDYSLYWTGTLTHNTQMKPCPRIRVQCTHSPKY